MTVLRLLKGLRLVVLGLVGIASIGIARGQAQVTDSPEHRRVYATLERLQEKGILVGYQFSAEGSPLREELNMRHTIAMAIHAAYLEIVGSISDLEGGIDELEEAADNGEQLEMLEARAYPLKLKLLRIINTLVPEIRPLIHLTYAFHEDLLSIGVDPRAMRSHLYDAIEGYTPLHKSAPQQPKSNPKVGAKIKPRA